MPKKAHFKAIKPDVSKAFCRGQSRAAFRRLPAWKQAAIRAQRQTPEE